LVLILCFPLGACSDRFQTINASTGDEIEMEQLDEGLNDDLDTPESKACRGKVVTETSNLNIRTSPNLGNNVCGSLPSQSYVTLLGQAATNGFYAVKTDACLNEQQFVSARFIELSADCDLELASFDTQTRLVRGYLAHAKTRVRGARSHLEKFLLQQRKNS